MENKVVDVFVLSDQFKLSIESIATQGKDKLLVGTTEGTLMIFQITYDPKHPKKFICDLKPEEMQKNFSKRSISKLCVIEELDILISICDGYTKIHSLHDFQELDIFCLKNGTKLKGCTNFTIKKEQTNYTIAISSKKMLHIFKFDTKSNSIRISFILIQEHLLPEDIKNFSWFNEYVLVGLKKNYLLFHESKKESKILFSSGNNTSLSFSLPEKEVIVARDGNGITIDFEGKPTRRYGLNFNELPNIIGYLNPYLICCLKDSIEIRWLRNSQNGTLIQKIQLNSIITCSQENFIDLDLKRLHGMREKFKDIKNNDSFDYTQRMFFAAKHKIFLICLKKFDYQVNEMQQNYNFDDALMLTDSLNGTQNEIDKSRIENLHLEYAFHLFKLGDYKNAAQHFIKTNTDPRVAISLIPNLLIGTEDLNVFAHEDKVSIHKILEDPTQLNKALSAIRIFLTNVRIPIGKDNLDKHDEKIGESVDSALLRCYLETQPNLLGPYLRMPNRCNLEYSEDLLIKNKKYTELVIFYQQKELHEKALNLLKKISIEKEEGNEELFGIKPTIEYLKKLKDKNLIFEHSKWIIFQNPKEGLNIFIREENDVDFEFSEILNFIEEITKDSNNIFESIKLKISFLEKVVKHSNNSDVHNNLILFYSQFLKIESKDQDSQKNEENEKLKILYKKKLKNFLIESKYYNPGKLLSTFLGKEGMWEERAILLSRVNSHKQALEIYVYRLKKLNLAEKYCEDHFNENDEESKDVFLILLDLILNQSTTTLNQSNQLNNDWSFENAIRILEKYFDKINSIKVLELLPNDISIKNLNQYYSLVFRKQNEKKRELQILKNLSKIENLQIKQDLVHETSRYVLIKQNRICQICHKNIGTRVFLWYPNGTIIHKMCSKDETICPITGTKFLKEENLKHGIYTPE
eukprot:gene1204-11294_t